MNKAWRNAANFLFTNNPDVIWRWSWSGYPEKCKRPTISTLNLSKNGSNVDKKIKSDAILGYAHGIHPGRQVNLLAVVHRAVFTEICVTFSAFQVEIMQINQR